MTIEREKTRTGFGGVIAFGAAVTGLVVLGLGNPADQYEDPAQDITVTTYKDYSRVSVLLDHKGGIARLRAPGEKKFIHEQNYFARKLSVAFADGKIDEAGSCVTLNYHFSAGTGQNGLNLNDDVVQVYLNAVPAQARAVISQQLKNAAARIDKNDPAMEGPISFMTNEVCGPAALKAYPDALKKAEAVNRTGQVPKP